LSHNRTSRHDPRKRGAAPLARILKLFLETSGRRVEDSHCDYCNGELRHSGRGARSRFTGGLDERELDGGGASVQNHGGSAFSIRGTAAARE
jgi:hypothetical protein